ncbi:hypothetical protein DL96DRAFT_1717482 [Flagelloscypha sp. PMI_526]|nr:hypothetical protein DL96DRAFT_1717482 [Flagelloscypha sp. PMI_526]
MSNKRASNSRAWRNSFAKKTKSTRRPDYQHVGASISERDTPSQTVPFTHIPFELFGRICSFLNVRDIIALRQCSKLVQQWTKDHAIWHQILDVYCSLMQFSLESFIPSPLDYSSSQLEQIASRHLRFNHYLTESGVKPRPTKTYTLPTFGKVISFKSIYPMRFILAVCGRVTLNCWDLGLGIDPDEVPRIPSCTYQIDTTNDPPNSRAHIEHYCFTGNWIYFSVRLSSNATVYRYGRILIFELIVTASAPEIRLCTDVLDPNRRLMTANMLLAYPKIFFHDSDTFCPGFYNVETPSGITWTAGCFSHTFLSLDTHKTRTISLDSDEDNLQVCSLPDDVLAKPEHTPTRDGRFPKVEAPTLQNFPDVFGGLDLKLPHWASGSRFSADVDELALMKFDVWGYLPALSSRPKDPPSFIIRRMQVLQNPESSDLDSPYQLQTIHTQTCPFFKYGDSQVLPGGRRWLWWIEAPPSASTRTEALPRKFKVYSSHIEKRREPTSETDRSPHTLFSSAAGTDLFQVAFSPFMGRACIVEDGQLKVKEYIPVQKEEVQRQVDSDWDSSD